MCGQFVIIDTHIALTTECHAEHNGKSYEGMKVREHADDDSDEVRRGRVGASLDNPLSFWFTRVSLCRALIDAGFTAVCECHAPLEPSKPANRVTIIATKGEPVQLSSYPWVNNKTEEEIEAFLSKFDQQSETQPANVSQSSARQLAKSMINVVLRPLGVEIRRRDNEPS
jgi:hypothetical protein